MAESQLAEYQSQLDSLVKEYQNAQAKADSAFKEFSAAVQKAAENNAAKGIYDAQSVYKDSAVTAAQSKWKALQTEASTIKVKASSIQAQASSTLGATLVSSGEVVTAQQAVALYGVFRPVPIKKDPTKTINITFSELEQNISTLKSATQTLKDSWSTKVKKNITTLQNSWVGPDCEAYINKLNGADKRVTNAIAALELLTTTFEKAKNMAKEAQTKTTSAVNNK